MPVALSHSLILLETSMYFYKWDERRVKKRKVWLYRHPCELQTPITQHPHDQSQGHRREEKCAKLDLAQSGVASPCKLRRGDREYSKINWVGQKWDTDSQ